MDQVPGVGERTAQRVATAWLVLAGLSAADMGYLTFKRVSGEQLNCFVANGCNVVAQSPFATLLGIPLSLLGFIFFAAVALLATLYLIKRQRSILIMAAVASLLGALMAWWYEYVQYFVIYAVCIYCAAAAALATANAALAAIVLWPHRRTFWEKIMRR